MARFYENDGEADEPQQVPIVEQQRSEDEPEIVSPTTQTASKPKQRSKNTTSKFATVHTLNTSSDDDEEGQAFYAGGSEHSGQQVLGPPRKNIVADMFKSVQE